MLYFHHTCHRTVRRACIENIWDIYSKVFLIQGCPLRGFYCSSRRSTLWLQNIFAWTPGEMILFLWRVILLQVEALATGFFQSKQNPLRSDKDIHCKLNLVIITVGIQKFPQISYIILFLSWGLGTVFSYNFYASASTIFDL